MSLGGSNPSLSATLCLAGPQADYLLSRRRWRAATHPFQCDVVPAPAGFSDRVRNENWVVAVRTRIDPGREYATRRGNASNDDAPYAAGAEI